MKIWPYAAAVSLGLWSTPGIATQPTVVFPIGFDDTSLQGGPSGAEQERLSALDRLLRAAIAQSGCCTVLEPPGQRLAMRMESCDGCELDQARSVGAGISVTGWVQKVSNLILNINLVARNVGSGQIIAAGSVDIRGNTDESWARGLSYLVRNRLHPAQW